MSADVALPAGPGARLHAGSPLYELLHNAWQAAPTLIGMLLAAGSDRYAVFGVIGLILLGIGMALYSVVSAWRFRYWLDAEDLVLLSGVLGRRVRRIPWARVENVTLRRNLLHRLTGVAEVVVEAGGALTAEAHLRVLSWSAALDFERSVRARVSRQAQPAAVDVEAHSARRTLLKLPTAELVRAGLISNQGALAAGAVIAASWQAGDYLPVRDWAEDIVRALTQWIGLSHGWLFWAALALLLLVLLLAVMRALSIGWWLLMYHGFELVEEREKLSSEHGLFTRVRGSAHLQRIQRLLVLDGVLYRWFQRQAVQIGVAGQREALNAESTLRWLAPVLPPAQTDALLHEALPQLNRRALRWQPLHASAARRVATRHALWLLLLVAPAFKLPWLALLLPVALLAIALDAWSYARHSSYACDGAILGFRHGLLSRQEWYVPIARIETVTLSASPFDRRAGTATLSIDLRTRGPGGRARIPFLPRQEAEELARTLRARVAE